MIPSTHRLFSHPEMVADMLRDFLDESLIAELDLAKMKRLNTKFTSPSGDRKRGDMVWEIPTRTGESLFVLLILEFQSRIDGWMVLRIGVYANLLYQQLVDERKLKPHDGLPPILPVLLYNGKPRWRAATRLRDLIRLPANSPLWNYQPDICYYTIDEGRFPDEDLKGRRSLTAIFIRIQHPANQEAILKASHDLVTWFAEHPDGPPVKTLFRELLTVGLTQIKGPHPHKPIPEGLEEVVNMLASHFEKWSRDIELRGEKKGKKKGEKKGEKKGAAKMLMRQLQHRFGTLPEWTNEKIANAKPSSLEEWGLRFVSAQSLDEVFSDKT